jgi:hypothetical protein
MNNSRKGAGKELLARRILESEGWLVDYARKTGRFVKQKDLYGLFDLLAVKEGLVLFVQVTHLKSLHAHQPYIDFAGGMARNPWVLVEQWAWEARKGFLRYQYTPTGYLKNG